MNILLLVVCVHMLQSVPSRVSARYGWRGTRDAFVYPRGWLNLEVVASVQSLCVRAA